MKVVPAVLIFAVLFVTSCLLGAANLHLREIFDGNFSAIDWQVFWYSRVPRSFAIVLAGLSLSIAGLIMQILLANRFVEPSMVGTTQGASLGLLAMAVHFPASSVMLKMFVAAVCGLVTTLFFLRLIKNSSPQNTLLIPLVGIIYSGVLGSIGLFFAFEYDLIQMLDVWLNGEFSSVLLGRYELLWLALIAAVIAYIFADRLTIAGLGQAMATNLGLSYKNVVTIGLIIVTLVVASVVVTIGNIAFLGLIVPNVISRMMGDNIRASLPWVAYVGASLLLVCDILARWINYPYEIPVSLIMGIIGAAVFLYLLFGAKKKTATS